MIIGISGHAGSGKDTFADLAVEEFGAEKIAFAAGVKEEVKAFLKQTSTRFHDNNLYGTQAEKEMNFGMVNVDVVFTYMPEFEQFVDKYGERDSYFHNNVSASFRSLLQWWGTEYRRSQDDQYWIKRALAKCKYDTKLYVISDCRFKNEAQGVLDAGGVLVRIERPNGFNVSNSTHPSEVDLDDWSKWNVVILNDTTLDDYRAVSREVLKRLKVNGKTKD